MPFTHPCASIIVSGVYRGANFVELFEILDGVSKVAKGKLLDVPGSGFNGLDGKLPLPVIINSPSGLAPGFLGQA